MRIKKNIFFLILLTTIGALLHFYNLNWGAPFYFHPDERNIASAVNQLQFPSQMNPHFFAYGSLPIYTIYFTAILCFHFSTLIYHFSFPTVTFEQAIQISRFYSALFATALIPLLFFIGKKLKNETVGLLTAFLATTSVGLIQFAHFGTFEMWLTFFTVLLFWTCISPQKQLTKQRVLLLGLFIGILVAVKISHLVIVPLIVSIIIIKKWQENKKNTLPFFFKVTHFLLLFFITSFLVYYVTNPFVFLDTQSFKNSMEYESSLAIGKLLVFYTGEFFNTIPIFFQFTNIYPFLLNPLITLLFIPSLIYLCWKSIKSKNQSYIILNTFYIILFLSQAFLFAKWTRYMVPTLPFIFLIIALALEEIHNKKLQPFNYLAILTIFIFINILFAFSYFITAFVRNDTRVEAYTFAQKNIPANSPILSEVYDLGIVPFNATFSDIYLFNFYELDNNSPEATMDIVQQYLTQKNYLILPSQRIIKTRLMNKEKFPQGNVFYTKLLSEDFGFQKIYETPCDLFCKITYLGNPANRFEQTANVFDRPTVMIFKKL